MDYRRMAQARRQVAQKQVIRHEKFMYGLNVNDHPSHLVDGEMAEAINVDILESGKLRTRAPVKKYSASAIPASVYSHRMCIIGNNSFALLGGSNSRLYYLDPVRDPVEILTPSGDPLAAPPEIISYNDVAIILDGGYIKYVDESLTIKLAYDDGTGPTGYQFNDLGLPNDNAIKLGDGTNSRVATKFTTENWGLGYTIPPTYFQVQLSNAGDPTGMIYFRVRKVSDDSVIAEGEVIDAGKLTEESQIFEGPLTATSELEPAVEYYFSVEFDGGDDTNHVLVRCSDVTGAGTAWYYTTEWNHSADQTLLMSVQPGLPPKGKFGDVHMGRLFIGGDENNAGRLFFSNLTHLDWSTPSGGGWVGAVDDARNNFPVGGIIEQYNTLWIFGRRAQPYIAKLTGDSPANFSISRTMQKGWTTHRVLASSINDIWFSSADGANHLTGVQQYGDVRYHQASDPVRPRFLHWDPDTTVAGVNPYTGQYMISFNDTWRILVCHTKHPRQMPGGEMRYPWTEFVLTREHLTDFGQLKWVESENGEHEWYCLNIDGSNPDLPLPDFVINYSYEVPFGYVGNLTEFTYGYGDNDSLGFNTVYFKCGSDNLLRHGESFERWDISPSVVLTPDKYESPYYDKTADEVIFDGTADAHVMQNRNDLDPNTQYTFSIFIRNTTSDTFNPDEIIISAWGDVQETVITEVGTELSTEWQRFDVTFMTTASPASVSYQLRCGVPASLAIFGAFLNKGGGPGQYVGNPMTLNTDIRRGFSLAAVRA